jgi:hypothetical protein
MRFKQRKGDSSIRREIQASKGRRVRHCITGCPREATETRRHCITGCPREGGDVRGGVLSGEEDEVPDRLGHRLHIPLLPAQRHVAIGPQGIGVLAPAGDFVPQGRGHDVGPEDPAEHA